MTEPDTKSENAPTPQVAPAGDLGMAVGTVVGSTSHVMIEARVYDASLKPDPPQAVDYAFGTFVGIRSASATAAAPLAVGVIANSRLLNPDEGYAGPRLTVPQSQNQLFAPDYLNELGIQVSILVLGSLESGHGEQSVVREVLPVGSEVSTLSGAARHRFHHAAHGAFQMRYTPLLQEGRPGLSLALLQEICRQLAADCDPHERRMMETLRKHIAWQATFQAM